MNLKTCILTLISSVFICLSVSAQGENDESKYPRVVVLEGDTVIVYSFDQGRELTLWNEQRKECLELLEIEKLENTRKDTVIQLQDQKIYNLESANYKLTDISEAKDKKLSICESEKQDYKDEVKKQKTHKIIAIISGIVITIIAVII